MRNILLLVAAFLSLAGIARADNVSKKAKVEELFTLTRMDLRMKQLSEAEVQQARSMLSKLPPEDSMTEKQKAITHEFEEGAVRLVEIQMGWETLKPEYIDLYIKTYSEEEVDGILAFYKSPIGQKLVAKTPELTANMIEISKRANEQTKAKLDELMRTYLEKLAAT